MSFFFFSSRRRHTRLQGDWSSDVCSSDLAFPLRGPGPAAQYLATITEDRAAALKAIDRPCLVVGFSEDTLTPPAQCRETAEAIPGCRYLEIPACGHFGFLEQPDEVNRALVEFLLEAC